MSNGRRLGWAIGLLLGLSAHPLQAEINPPHPVTLPAPVLLPVCVNVFERQCGLLDRAGHWVVEPAHNQIYVRRDGWLIEDHGDEGLLGPDGKLLIAPRFDSIGEFDHGLAPASLGMYRSGYIDRHGEWVIPPTYFLAGAFVDGIAVVGEWIGGPNDGHSQMHYITPDGQPAFAGSWNDAGAFRFGMAAVDRGPSVRTASNIDKAKMALIDRHGRQLVSWRNSYRLTPLSEDRLLESGADREALLDRHGKTLFSVSSEGYLRDLGEGRLAFRLGESNEVGLLDMHTGRPLVTPENGWSYATSFSDGLAWVSVRGGDGAALHAAIDRQGRTVIAPGLYRQGEDFFAGAAPVSVDGDKWQLLARDGKPLTEAVYRNMDPAWYWGRQSPRTGDVWRAPRIDKDGVVDWVDAQGRILVTVEKLACGIDVVRNALGESIWPQDVDANCAVAAADHEPDQAMQHVAGIDPARLVAIRRARAQKRVAGLLRVQDMFDKRASKTPAGTPTTRQKMLQAPWVRGPATITLDEATLLLPAGYRYLAPEYVPALREMLDKSQAPARDQPTFAVVASDDLSMVLRVLAVHSGHVRLDSLPLDAESLVKRMEDRISAFGTTRAGDYMNHVVEWLRPPHFDAKAHRLGWSYSELPLTGYPGRHYSVNSVVLGRQSLVALQGLASGMLAEDQAWALDAAMEQIAAGVHFEQGRRYTDAVPGTDADGPDVIAYITTAPMPKPSAPLSSVPAEGRGSTHWWWLWLVLLPMAAGLWLWRRSRHP